MSCNCKGEDLRKKYSGMFFTGVGSKPEKAAEKKLKEKSKKKNDESNG